MTAWLLSQALPWLIGGAFTILAALGLYAKGHRDAKAKAETKAAKDAMETIRRIEDAKDNAAAGGAGWHDRLHATKPK